MEDLELELLGALQRGRRLDGGIQHRLFSRFHLLQPEMAHTILLIYLLSIPGEDLIPSSVTQLTDYPLMRFRPAELRAALHQCGVLLGYMKLATVGMSWYPWVTAWCTLVPDGRRWIRKGTAAVGVVIE